MLGLSRKRRQEKHSRELTAAETAETEQRIYDVVRERMLAAVGPGGLWSVSLRSATDIDTFFAETIAESFARDIVGLIGTQNITSDLPAFESGPLTTVLVANAPVTDAPLTDAPLEHSAPGVIEHIDARLVA